MLSPADMLVVGVAALLFFGPDQLPKVARRAGQVVRDVQATSTSFIREMERAADEQDHHVPYVPPAPYPPPAPYIPNEPYAADPEPLNVTPHPAPSPARNASDEPPSVTIQEPHPAQPGIHPVPPPL